MPWRGVAGGFGLVWLGLVTPKRIRTSPASIWIAAEGHIPSKQQESGDHMKLWKCDPYVLDNKGFVTVVVMAETRQQAIEKASAKLSAKLPEMLGALGQVLPDDDYRRFAQLGSDNLDNTLEEAPDEVVITILEPPSVVKPVT
jgi:hypothetical protein